jgi:hypothetical protein
MRGWLGAALVAAFLACSHGAQAQAASDAAAADALFNEAQKLAAAGNYAQACPKYAESLRLDTGIGVMLYLADCYERTGKTASAWVQFREAEELASKQADRRAAAAHDRAARLEPVLARLVIRLGPGVDLPGLELKRDTTLVGRAQWEVPVPVDPGVHTIIASAPGKKTRTMSVLVVAGGSPTTLTVAPLEDESVATTEPPPRPQGTSPSELPVTEPATTSTRPGNTERIVAYAVGAAGLVGIVVGSYFGFDTISKNNAANSDGNCHSNGDNELCNKTGLPLNQAAQSSATASNIAFGLGAAALAGGVVLYLTSPRSPSPAVGIATTPDGRGGGFSLHMAW